MSFTTNSSRRETSFRLIHHNTVQASLTILEKANHCIKKYSMEGSTFELPEYGKAVALLQRLDEGRWPVIIKVNSEVDRELLSQLKEAREWLFKVVRHVDLSRCLTTFLDPFPVFKSCHLQTKQDGRVINRKLVTLQDNCTYNFRSCLGQEEDTTAYYARRSLPIFNEMRIIAQWMCEDPEQRLYRKRLDPVPTMSSTVYSGNDIGNGGVLVQTYAQSQADSDAIFTPSTTRTPSPHFMERCLHCHMSRSNS